MYNEALSRSFNFPARGRCHGGKQDCKDKGPRIPVRKDFIVRCVFYSYNFAYIYKTIAVCVYAELF